MRKIGIGSVGLVVAAVACGETSKHGPTSPPAGGSATGGEAAAGVPSVAGSNALGGMPLLAAGGAAGDDGAGAGPVGGAGGAPLEPLPGYSLVFVPPFAPPEGSIPPAEGSLPNLLELGMSRDGSRVFATMDVAYVGDVRHELLTWTAETGSARVPVPRSNQRNDMPNTICVADDGSAAFFTREKLDALDAYHWNPKTGLGQLPPLAGLGVFDASCDATATHAAFQIKLTKDELQTELRYWAAGENGDAAKLVPWPLPSQERGRLDLSRFGGRGVINGTGNGSPMSKPFAWTPSDGAAPLGTPDEECGTDVLSDDGSAIAGTCISGGFRWSAATGYVPLGPGATPRLLSPDGTWLWGQVYASGVRRLGLWTGPGPGQTFDLPSGWDGFQLLGTAEAGHIAFLYLMNVFGSPDTTLAARWTVEGGLAALPLLPGTTQSEISAFSDDGTLVAGHATGDGGTVAYDNPVIWDAKGPRDVLQELRDGQVDVDELSQVRIWTIWPGSPLRFHGICTYRGSSQIFFAELPAR